MKCRETKKLFTAYLDKEITASENKLLQEHLAGCQSCRGRLEIIASTRSKLSFAMKNSVALIEPPQQSWSRLRSVLETEARASHHRFRMFQRLAQAGEHHTKKLKGEFSMKKLVAISASAIIIALIAVVSFVPSVRAEVTEWFSFIFRVKIQDSEVAFTTNADLSFQAYQPGSLPETFAEGPDAINVSNILMEIVYQNGEDFLVIVEKPVSEGETLPEGDPSLVNDLPAVTRSGLSGLYEPLLTLGELEASGHAVAGEGVSSGEITPDTIDENVTLTTPITIAYSSGNQLIWIEEGTHIELLSNLSMQELITIAEGMQPAK